MRGKPRSNDVASITTHGLGSYSCDDVILCHVAMICQVWVLNPVTGEVSRPSGSPPLTYLKAHCGRGAVLPHFRCFSFLSPFLRSCKRLERARHKISSHHFPTSRPFQRQHGGSQPPPSPEDPLPPSPEDPLPPSLFCVDGNRGLAGVRG